MRPLTRADRNRLFSVLDQWCSRRTIVALRTRALIALAADSGLRVGECVRLDLSQVLLEPKTRGGVRLASEFWLRPSQAKGGAAGAGMIAVSDRARNALREYIRALRAAQWVPWPPAEGAAATPLFLTLRMRRGRPGHVRLSVRSAQWSWHSAQRRAGLVDVDDAGGELRARYRFHDLRHDTTTRLRGAGADVYDLQAQMRWKDLRHAQRYVHEVDGRKNARALVNKAARG